MGENEKEETEKCQACGKEIPKGEGRYREASGTYCSPCHKGRNT